MRMSNFIKISHFFLKKKEKEERRSIFQEDNLDNLIKNHTFSSISSHSAKHILRLSLTQLCV